MSTPSDALPLAPEAVVRRPAKPISTLTCIAWSVRREIWENKSLYLGPIIAALFVLLAVSIGVSHVTIPPDFDVASKAAMVMGPLASLAGPIMFVSFVIAFFYCLDALYGEKRDRSILFWKSLPLSDLVVVSSKVTIPMLVVPAITLITAMALQLIVLIVGSAILAARGISVTSLITTLPLFQFWGVQMLRVAALVLWYSPLFAWLFLVSVCAKRTPFVWAILIPIGAAVLERIAFGSFYIGRTILERLAGGGKLIEVAQSENNRILSPVPATDITPLVSSAAFWIGLGIAIAILAAVVYLRRSREPV
jgi:ABC-2 type transport system permease protein